MFKEIYLHLKEQGFNVYSIGQHKGKCLEPYLVITETGDMDITGSSLMHKTYEILIYYPVGKYSGVSTYIDSVKKAMRGLKLRRVITSNPIIIDDDKQAYMTFLSYTRIKIKER